MSICSVDGCELFAKSKGLCGKHYQRMNIHGSTDDYLGCQVVRRVCSVDGCGKPFEARGLCEKHYARFKKYGTPEDGRGTHAPVEVRFWRYVDKSDGCWLWTGKSLNKKGYGQIQIGGQGTKHILAHRLSYEIHCGPIPDGMVVMHSCDNPGCVNPDHLSLGTQSQNILDAFARGRKNAIPPHVFGEKCGASKLTEAQAIDVIKSSEPMKILAARFGVSNSAIERIKNGKTWRHLPRT